MTTRFSSRQRHSAVHQWWDATNEQLCHIFEDFMTYGAISDNQLEKAIHYVDMQRQFILKQDYPNAVIDIQTDLLRVLDDVQQSLVYRAGGDEFSAHSRHNMAIASMDALRFRLIQYGVIA